MFFSAQKALAFERKPQKPAIVLAAFGTTEIEALKDILNIRDRVGAAFPGYDVHLAFTSNIIRGIWHERAGDDSFKSQNPGLPQEIYEIGNPLTVLAGIQENGARLVLVQSLHISDGEEYRDLDNLVKALAGLKPFKPVLHPFPWIGVGEPALGVGDGQPAYLERAAAALAPLAEEAKKSGAALILMGHGNEHLTQAVYGKLQAQLRKKYGPWIYIGTVEAPPQVDDVIASLDKAKNRPGRVLLTPLMIVAGDHARNDMAGSEEDSWASKFKAKGYEVTTRLEGLGSNDSWADIYVEHLRALEAKVVKLEKADAAGTPAGL
jgi:sirohydrochlorin cobaltochelatase